MEQSYKQVKDELGWADFQVRSDTAIRRHQVLVNCAFSFCWDAVDQESEPGTRAHLDQCQWLGQQCQDGQLRRAPWPRPRAPDLRRR